MRSNVFKKALIMAAAAFVTAVIGIGGAKLKVQAHDYTGAGNYATGANVPIQSPVYMVPYSSYIQNGAKLDASGVQDTKVYYFESDETTPIGDPLGQNVTSDTTVDMAVTGGDGDGWVLFEFSDAAGNGYIKLKRPFKIEYQDGDGNVLQTSYEFNGLSTPPYDEVTNGTPTKTPSGGYTYLWNSTWTPTVAATVTADATYVANFTGTLTNYTITWKNDDGTTLRTDTVAAGNLPSYGGTPSKPDDANYTYTFSMWNPTVQLATADATYTAVYLQDPKPATGGGSEPDSSSSTGDGSGSGSGAGSSSGDGTNGGANGGANGNRAPKTADTMPGIIVIALAGLLGGVLLITGGRKASK